MDYFKLSDSKLRRQSQIAFLAIVFIGYGISLTGIMLGGGWATSPWGTAISIVLGFIYIAWGLRFDDFYQRTTSTALKVSLFVFPLLIVFVVQILLGPNGTWLLTLPVVGTAVENLRPVCRWPIYIFSIVGFAIPAWVITGNADMVIGIAAALIPAVLFVVALTNLRMSEQRSREEAESLAAKLEKANRQLATYAVQAEEMATIEERNRMAREIHDNLGHYLTVVNVQIEAARAVMKQDPDLSLDALQKAQKLTKEGLTAVRQSVAALREAPTDKRTLIDAITALSTETRSSGLVVDFVVEGQRRSLDPKIKLTLYRVAQEGLTNVRKHARASRVNLLLDYGNPVQVRLVVHDNGVGTSKAVNGGFGLIGMRERVQLLGGDLQIETAPGKGFRLESAVPG